MRGGLRRLRRRRSAHAPPPRRRGTCRRRDQERRSRAAGRRRDGRAGHQREPPFPGRAQHDARRAFPVDQAGDNDVGVEDRASLFRAFGRISRYGHAGRRGSPRARRPPASADSPAGCAPTAVRRPSTGHMKPTPGVSAGVPDEHAASQRRWHLAQGDGLGVRPQAVALSSGMDDDQARQLQVGGAGRGRRGGRARRRRGWWSRGAGPGMHGQVGRRPHVRQQVQQSRVPEVHLGGPDLPFAEVLMPWREEAHHERGGQEVEVAADRLVRDAEGPGEIGGVPDP